MMSVDTIDSVRTVPTKHPGRYTWYSRAPFLVTTALGMGGMTILKNLDQSQSVVTTFACVLLITYWAVVSSVPILRIREDQLADNCYYIGFLFTLFSLAWALYQFAIDARIEVIIGNFGIALGSTIFGVVLRVFINQARRDVLETEKDARLELAQAVVRLRAEIDDAVLALSSFCRTARQSAQEQIEATAEESAKALEEGTKQVGAAATEVIAKIDEAFTEFKSHASSLNESSAGTVTALKSLLKKIEKIDAPSDLVSRRLEPAMAAAEEVARRLTDRARADDELLSSFLSRAKTIYSTLETAAASLRDINDSSITATSAAQAAVDKMASLSRATEDIVAEHQRLVAKIREHNEGLATEFGRARKAVAETSGALVDLAETVTERLK